MLNSEHENEHNATKDFPSELTIPSNHCITTHILTCTIESNFNTNNKKIKPKQNIASFRLFDYKKKYWRFVFYGR